MNHSLKDHESGDAIARIEAQDVLFVEPVREYLEHYGCQVVVNKDVDKELLYFICVGDPDFVKSFIERHSLSAKKKLAIVYEGDSNDLSELRTYGVKLCLVDAKTLTDRDIQDIFAFLITSKKELLDARKDPNATPRASVIPKEPLREPARLAQNQVVVDTRRIAQYMQQIFAPVTLRKYDKGRRRLYVVGLGWTVGLLVLCITPLLLYITSVVLSVALLWTSSKTLISGNMSLTTTLIGYSRSQIRNSQTLLHLFSPIVYVLRLGGFAEDEDRLLTILSDATQAESGVVTIFQSSKDVGAAILFPKKGGSDTNASDVTTLTSEVTRVSQHLALIQAELDSLLSSRRFPFRSAGVKKLGNRGLAALEEVRTLVAYTEKLLTLYPQMGGFRRRQTYLVLLQNSMELRPTGGFIGSMLLVSFVDGFVDDMHVLDVYDADGQLKGHIDPPQAIREIMGVEHWYLRDSNWDPDFSVSGKQAGWFYEKEMGQPVDGVIAASLPLVTNLLHVIGPVEVPDFNERISESNFFAKSLLYTQTDFFPGSTQKKDFLGALTTAMLLRMTGDRSLSAGPLLRTIADSIQKRDIQFYFSDIVLQQLVTQWGWDGSMRIGPCAAFVLGSDCIGDGVGIIEANLGVNKVNYFVTHEALSDLTIQEDGSLEQTLIVNVQNTTPSHVPLGGGVYQTYFRVYYPAGTRVGAVTFDGIDVPRRDSKQTSQPPLPYVVMAESDQSVVVSIPFSVSPKQEHQVMITTTRNTPQFTGQASYQFTVRKQAGVSSYPWHVVLHFPPAWTALSQSALAKPGILEYNTDLTKDLHIDVLFQKL